MKDGVNEKHLAYDGMIHSGGETLDPADLQGGILRGFGRSLVRHVMLEVTDRRAARAFLGACANGQGALPITTEEHWGATKPDVNFNVGLTHFGLSALGVAPLSLADFPTEFRAGMETRGDKLGDVGGSAPSNWPAPFDQPERIHVIATLHADVESFLNAADMALASVPGFTVLGARSGANFDGPYVHFGYHDNISQPRFQGVHDPSRFPDAQPQVPLGTALLGYESVYEGIRWKVPKPEVLGKMGSFNAFRVLEQDVVAFEAFLTHAAEQIMADPRAEQVLAKGSEDQIGKGLSYKDALREVVAAKLCGRWRNGTPLELSPDTPQPDPDVPRSDFDYNKSGAGCPFGAHTRRCNPRGGPIVQRIANNTRRLVRRGVPYGPAYDPAKPDAEERGLLGNFICGNLGAQFEAVMCDWLNLGLQDPNITGTNDPLLGANDPDESYFEFPLLDGTSIRLDGLPRLVHVRGGAYTFLPSVPALRYIAGLQT
ncbi:MAG: hypothetical protein AAGM84_01760 [Pseudomonadota bacterium]